MRVVPHNLTGQSFIWYGTFPLILPLDPKEKTGAGSIISKTYGKINKNDIVLVVGCTANNRYIALLYKDNILYITPEQFFTNSKPQGFVAIK